jgi:hypothetical protein
MLTNTVWAVAVPMTRTQRLAPTEAAALPSPSAVDVDTGVEQCNFNQCQLFQFFL